MKSLIFYILIIFTFCQCGSTTKTIESCTREKVKNLADMFLDKKKFVLNDYICSIKENEEEYVIKYRQKDTMKLGDGAVIIITKETCKVTESILYQ